MSETVPLFSVVTVCKNCKDKLLRTAKSVHEQKFQDFEYIIKDGASNDGTLEVCKENKAANVISGPDNGIFNAMNIALDFCSGEYVIFLNAGDTFCDNYVLTTFANNLLQNGHVDFLYGNIVSLKSRRRFISYPNKISRFFLYSDSICHQAWFVKRELYFELGKLDETKPVGGDYLFYLKSLGEMKVSYRHVDYFIAEYEGSGMSADSKLLQDSQFIRQDIRNAIFNSLERNFYEVIIKIRGILKKTLYDTWCYPLFKLYGLYHYKKQKKVLKHPKSRQDLLI